MLDPNVNGVVFGVNLRVDVKLFYENKIQLGTGFEKEKLNWLQRSVEQGPST